MAGQIKTATIQQAVTRGLNPHVPLKPSGIKWLGQAPAHWEVRKLKQCAIRYWAGGTPDSGKDDYYCNSGEGIPWVMISDMTQQSRVRHTANAISESGRASKRLEILPAGTILYSMYASLGTVSVLEIPACVNQAILGVQFDPALVNREFALLFLSTIQPYVVRLSSSSTQNNLNAEKVRGLPIFLPPIAEQSAIVEYLDKAITKIDKAIATIRREMELLREYRVRLISDVVTGKIDVRKAAAKLPAVENSDY